ncbi:hypothetical protein ES703_43160 [subsurface metagenome]
MTRGVRPSLPLMGKPYEGIELLLNLVAQRNPSQSELDELMQQHRQGDLQGLSYYSGHDDILYFCHKQLGLFEIINGVFKLTDDGREIYRFLDTPQFGVRLLQHLVECSSEKFSYFYWVYKDLESRVQKGDLEMPQTEFKAMVLEKSNKRSSKEVTRLLTGCGVILEKEDKVFINGSVFSMDLRQEQLERLWRSTAQILELDGRLIYPEILTRLQQLYPNMDWDDLERDFRSGLILSSTRASEYVDGILGSTG